MELLKFTSIKYGFSMKIPVDIIKKVVVHYHPRRNQRVIDLHLNEKYKVTTFLKGDIVLDKVMKTRFLTLKYLDEKLGKNFKRTKKQNTWIYTYVPPNSVRFIGED